MTELKVTSEGDKPDKMFEVVPDMADFDQILAGHKEKFKFELKNIDTVATNLVVVGAPTDDYIKKFKIKKDTLKPGQATKIEIELRDDLDLGVFKTALTLEAEGNPGSRISIPITGTIVEKIMPKPEPPAKPAAAEANPVKPTAKADLNTKLPVETAVSEKTVVKTDKTQKKPEQIKPAIVRDDSDLK